MRTLLFALLFLSALAAGCATANMADTCPESRKVRCMTRPICSFDRGRGCHLCRCEGPMQAEDPQGHQPPQRSNQTLPIPP